MRQPKSMDPDIARKTQVVKKVAVMSLTVPGSEDVEIVRQQLLAMTRIRYPHDSWILVDKEHSPTIQQMAQSLGVHYFSRHDVERWGEEKVKYWNQPVPPFKAKTKAGNVNSWIDAYGDAYSHFTQLDIDHKPVPEYLHKVLGYFLDPKVKWVQAPSVYGNVDTWTSRGSAEQEFVLQGPLQMGFYGFCQTPFIIGSHCTYDMAAIRAIGGFPTNACRRSPGHGIFSGPGTSRGLSSRGHCRWRWARELRYLPCSAVRLGIFDDSSLIELYTESDEALYATPGTPISLCADLVCAVVTDDVLALHPAGDLTVLKYADCQGKLLGIFASQSASNSDSLHDLGMES